MSTFDYNVSTWQIWRQTVVRYGPDPPENCHLTVKKLTKTWHFFQKNCQKLSFFQKYVKVLAIFWHSNGNFPEGQVHTLFSWFTAAMERIIEEARRLTDPMKQRVKLCFCTDYAREVVMLIKGSLVKHWLILYVFNWNHSKNMNLFFFNI